MSKTKAINYAAGTLSIDSEALCNDIIESLDALGARYKSLTISYKAKKDLVVMKIEGARKSRLFLDHLENRWNIDSIYEDGQSITFIFDATTAGKILKLGDHRGTLDYTIANHKAYAAQRAMTKKDLYKLVTGQWVELRWYDGPNTMAMLTDPFEHKDYSLLVIRPGGITGPISIDCDQVVAAYPAPKSPMPKMDQGLDYPIPPNGPSLDEMGKWLTAKGVIYGHKKEGGPYFAVYGEDYAVSDPDLSVVIRKAYHYLSKHL